MEKVIKSNAVNFGLYLGGFLTLLTVLAYAFKLDLLTSMWYGLFILIAVVVFGIISVAKSKALSNGLISFKNSFVSYFITVLLGLVISTVVSYLLFNVIDTDAAITLKELTIEAQVEMLEGFNVPSDQISEAVSLMEEQNMYSIGNLFKGLAGYIVMFSVIGLIVAAIMKKNDPDAA